MPATVVAGRSFIPGLRTEMLGTYRRQYQVQTERLSRLMTMDLPSTRRTEFHFFWQSAPHLVRWPYGEAMPEKGFKGIRFNVTNVRWAHAISWQADDRADDQTNSMLSHARGLGTSAAQLDERVWFQIVQGTSDGDLLTDAGSDPGNEDSEGGIPNAPDGQAIFSTTRDGSNNRFGAVSGNLLTGLVTTAGALTEANMRADYFRAREQFGLFQDTEGQPLFNPVDIDGEAIIVFATDNWDVAAAAFQRSVIPESNAGVSSETQAANITPTFFKSQRITSDDVYVGLNVPNKAVFSQSRAPISEVIATMENSDIARQQDEESIRFKMRKGYGVAEPYALIHVNAGS